MRTTNSVPQSSQLVAGDMPSELSNQETVHPVANPPAGKQKSIIIQQSSQPEL
jgi:hypothetical protein